MRALLTAALGAAFFMAAAGTSEAAPCGPRDQVLRHLAERYGEEPAGAGVTAGGRMAELFVSPDGGTWTLLETLPTGLSCLRAHGENWQQRRSAPRGEGA